MSTAASLHFTWRDKMSYSFFTWLRGWKGHMPVKMSNISAAYNGFEYHTYK